MNTTTSIINKRISTLLTPFSKRILLLFTTLLLAVTAAQAQRFTIGDLRYDVIPHDLNMVEVSAANANISGDITIPATITYESLTYTVTSIGVQAFYDCSSLTSVTLSEGVTNIGDRAFYYCSSLASVTIPEGVTSIGEWAFNSCSSLTSVTIPSSVTNMGEQTFSGCSSLASVTLFEGVTSIGDRTFYDCSGLTSVTIPRSVTSIGNYAFAGCTGLQSVEVKWGEPLAVPAEVFQWFDLSQVKLIIPDGTEAKYRQANVWRDFGSFNVTSVSGAPFANTLRAYAGGGMLHVSGLIPGERFYIYDLQGRQLYDSRATDDTQTLPLPLSGPCIVTTGRQSIKVWP
jgi:hypothetical protein